MAVAGNKDRLRRAEEEAKIKIDFGKYFTVYGPNQGCGRAQLYLYR